MTTSSIPLEDVPSTYDVWCYTMIPFYIAKYILILIVLETLLLRMPMFVYNYWYYKRQGATFFKNLYPIYGNFFSVCRLMSESPKQDYVPFGPMLEESFGKNVTPPDIVVSMMQSQAVIVLNTAQPLTDIYVTKNKFFDKDPISKIQFGSLFGDSIVLSSSNEEWSKKRKILSSAFYKDKLVRMTDTIRKVVAQKIEEFERDYVKTGQPMDIVKEIGDLHMRIILVSAFGLTNLNQMRLPYEQNGVIKELSIDQYLRKATSFMLFRAGRKIFSIIPYLMFFYYSAADREYKRNMNRIRDFCEKIINERKAHLIGPEKEKYVNNPDLLTILLSDDLFKNNNKAMIDEIITFFLAGSFTLRSVNSNMFMYLGMYPEVNKKLMNELIETHLKDFINDTKPVDTEKVYTFESVENLKYFVSCFYESLRMEPPTVASGGIYTEDQTFPNGLRVKKGDLFVINMQSMQNDKNEWFSPEKFMPERFDTNSPYYKRPDGNKRNPFSFNPFLGGKRICLGKTFAEIVAKFVVPALLSRFTFELVDQDYITGVKEKPKVNLDLDEDPVVLIKLNRVNLQKFQ